VARAVHGCDSHGAARRQLGYSPVDDAVGRPTASRPNAEGSMLGEKQAVATIPVKDIEVARRFYDETLGLKAGNSREPGVLTYQSGGADVLVYESRFAGTNKATAATWTVDDVEREVKVLKERGVSFEHYDMPGVTRDGDVHGTGRTKAAWFKDPDGNILAIIGP
jgi:catechol 2,3-dioxygenase-like lactoylglutathione lyase family enzyme